MTKESYYREWKAKYGMGHTRRDRILSLAKGSGLRILDVGCASGGLGARLKEMNNWVGGVELSEDGLRQARERLDQVWSFDIEGMWPEDLKQRDIDTIIFGEILEHVFDPVAVLTHARNALRDGGHIIITTPNFLTWTNRLKFLFGKFKYEEEGMFDFGHIRWFTYAYLKEVLERSGFQIVTERHILFPGKAAALIRRWPSLFAWQFIIKARVV